MSENIPTNGSKYELNGKRCGELVGADTQQPPRQIEPPIDLLAQIMTVSENDSLALL